MHEDHDALVGDHYELTAFRDLPEPYRLAIVHYMAVDGVAWDLGDEGEDDPLPGAAGPPGDRRADRERILHRLRCAMPRLVDEHGDAAFGVASVPMSAARGHVMARGDLATDWKGDWDAYHAWYAGNGDVPDHAPAERWPCIMSGFGDEAFEDGWHRFHAYARAGHADVPVVFYPEARHFEAKGLPVPPAGAYAVGDADEPSLPGMR
jgi:hypothetical protein